MSREPYVTCKKEYLASLAGATLASSLTCRCTPKGARRREVWTLLEPRPYQAKQLFVLEI